jgi:uncharacterized metal-binding protein YceD (DUF177 family)
MKRDTTGAERGADRGASHGPWRAFVPVAQIPDSGLHREIVADEATRAAMAEAAGVRGISEAHASFDLSPRSGGRVQVRGRVRARVAQTCVVTLEPLENEIDEEIDLIFAPVEQIPELTEPDDSGDDYEIVDAPEPMENGAIDLGRLATDVIYLAIDPYPRKPGAVFAHEATAVDPEDHPFAALKALKADPAPPKGTTKGSAKGKPRAK